MNKFKLWEIDGLLSNLNKQKENLYALLVLAIGLYISYFQLFGFDLKYIIGDLGDSRFISSIIEYNYQWMKGNYSGNYWDGFFMYPDNEVISYSDNLLGITPFYGVFRLSGANLLTAYQLVLLLSHLLNFCGAYYCFYKLTGNKFAAATGAFVFAFNLSLNSIHNHPQFTFRFAVPFAFLSLFNFLKSGQNKSLYTYASWLVFQFYLGIYIGYFLMLFSVVFAAAFFYTKKDETHFVSIKNAIKVIFLSLALFIVGVLPLFYYYYKRNKITGYYTSYNEILETVPQLKSYLIPFWSAYNFDFLKNISVSVRFPWYHQLFPGALTMLNLIVSFYFVFKQKNRLLLALLITLVFFLVFATNFNGTSLYVYLQKIPGFKAIRVVSRFILVSTFIYGWMLAINLLQIKSKVLINLLLVIFPLLLFFDNYCQNYGFSRFEKQEALNRIEALAAKINLVANKRQELLFAYIPKTNEESFKIQIDAMQTAVYLKGKTINGYSSSCHGSFSPFWSNHDSLSLDSWCKVMAFDKSKIIIIN